MFADIELAQVYGRLVPISRSLFRGACGLSDADDLFQEMVLCLIKNATDPRLSSLARITTRAAWHAHHRCDSDRTYRRYNLPMPVVITEDGEEIYYAELISAEDDTPEDLLIATEERTEVRSAMEKLPAKDKAIAVLLAQGLAKGEVARALGYKRPGTVSDRLVGIRQKFQECGLCNQ